MDVIVLIKRVPDTAARIRVADGGARIDVAGLEYATSPYDEIALEKAVQLKEALGGRVTALSLGPREGAKELRNALAVGADDAILLVDESPERDAVSTATTLAATLREQSFDLILAGWKAADTDDGAVPHLVAAHLGLPCVTVASRIEPRDGGLEVHREVEGGEEVVHVGLPAVVTAQKGLAEPRFASIKSMMQAKRKKIDERPAPPVDPVLRRLGIAEPAPRPPGKIVGHGAAAVPALVDALAEEREVL
jgi:electron transfer flavoprotein beta subunit